MLLQKMYSVLRLLDEIILVKSLDFDQYFAFHKIFNFPLKRMAFFLTQGYSINFDNPKNFNEKVVYRHLFERDTLLPLLVDKYAVREYVKKKIGDKYLIPLFQVTDNFDDIDFSVLPDEFIMKVTHGSGRNIIFKDGDNNYGYNKAKLKKIIEEWLCEKYRFQQLIWFVQPIERKIIIEKLLQDNGKIPRDYKFFVFNGKVEMIQVDNDRFSEHTRSLYDKEWNRLDCTLKYEQGGLVKRPEVLSEMIFLAERLAEDFTFMRVDFYNIESTIYFGELTPCPGGGMEIFVPESYNRYYGDKWDSYRCLIRERQ